MPNNCLILPFFLLLGQISPVAAQNDKQVIGDAVFTPGEISEGAAAMFLIRFQNLSIDTVDNVVVRDTLDPRFDAATIEMIDASHNYQMLRDQGYVRWFFNNIQLPGIDQESPGFTNSSGFILFSVQPRGFLEPGQSIQNRACISFDDELTLCTNYATIWIDEGAVSPEPDDDRLLDFKIIPNPNYGHFQVRSNSTRTTTPTSKVEWWVSDMTGKVIWDGSSTELAIAPNEVMLERPAPGLYMLWMKENGRLQVEQFAVIR